MRCLAAVALLSAFTVSATAQNVRFGLKGGIPTTDYFETDDLVSSATRRYTVGPSVEFRLEDRFQLEVDVIYKRMGYHWYFPCGIRCIDYGSQTYVAESSVHVVGNSWDVPVLIKYRKPAQKLRPYTAAGPVLRFAGPPDVRGTRTVVDLVNQTTMQIPFTPDQPSQAYAGLAVAAGVELGGGRVQVLPELRYSGWLKREFGDAQFERNQVEFLLGILF